MRFSISACTIKPTNPRAPRRTCFPRTVDSFAIDHENKRLPFAYCYPKISPSREALPTQTIRQSTTQSRRRLRYESVTRIHRLNGVEFTMRLFAARKDPGCGATLTSYSENDHRGLEQVQANTAGTVLLYVVALGYVSIFSEANQSGLTGSNTSRLYHILVVLVACSELIPASEWPQRTQRERRSMSIISIPNTSIDHLLRPPSPTTTTDLPRPSCQTRKRPTDPSGVPAIHRVVLLKF